jgi:hypothetical protein
MQKAFAGWPAFMGWFFATANIIAVLSLRLSGIPQRGGVSTTSLPSRMSVLIFSTMAIRVFTNLKPELVNVRFF